MLDAYEAQLENQIRREAQWVVYLMNASGNYADDPVTVDKLLGKTADTKTANDLKMDELEQRALRRKEERLRQRAASSG